MIEAMEPLEELADILQQLIDLPDDAFAERYALRSRQEELRALLRSDDNPLDAGRTDEELLAELAAMRSQMKAIEKQRIDLVTQAGGGATGASNMGNLGGVEINKGIGDAQGLPRIRSRIGILKNLLEERGVEVQEAD